MGLFLKQSTSATLQIGPLIDETDGKTAETGLTIAQADVRLSKNGANIAQKNEATSCTHDELGYYSCPIDATDTNTLGRLQLMVHESGALPVYHEYMVVPANVWDSLFGADVLQVDATQLAGVTQSLTDLKDFADAGYDPATNKVQGVVLTDTTTAVTNTVNLSAASEAQIDAIEGDTNELQTDWVNGGRLDLLLDAVALEATVAALNDLSADNVWDEVIEGTYTGRQYMRLLAAVLFGKVSGGGTTTNTFRDTADGTDRVTATVDSDGNRTAMTLDAT
jgi:hypothetical protein